MKEECIEYSVTDFQSVLLGRTWKYDHATRHDGRINR